MTQEVMGQAAACDTPQEVWSLVEQTYASQSRARTVNTRIALATTRNDDMSISEYITKMKNLADEMASAKKKVDDEELVSYILAGLDEEYNPMVSALLARVEPVSIAEAHSQLLSFENRINLMHGGHQASANAAHRGRGSPGHRGRGRSDRGRGGFGRGYGSQGGHHNLLDALKTDVSTRSVKSVRRKDTQPWIAGIVTTRATHPPAPKLLQLLHKGMVLIRIGILTLLQQITLLQS
jgi:hypothetical protein